MKKSVFVFFVIACFVCTSPAFAEGVKIIYEANNGELCILTPSPKSKHSLEEIIAKDVPKGRPYKIISDKDLPKDRKTRATWKIGDFQERGLAYGKEHYKK